MFGDGERDKSQTMGQMISEAMQKCNANRVEAKAKVMEMVKRDRRFDGYDHDRLLDKVMEKSQYGGYMDWDDPGLKRGGQPRPLALKGRSGAI
jgi:hypothetical protein